jgi:chloramphenicol O-acetyltransferase
MEYVSYNTCKELPFTLFSVHNFCQTSNRIFNVRLTAVGFEGDSCG